jgi:hypothetical protein
MEHLDLNTLYLTGTGLSILADPDDNGKTVIDEGGKTAPGPEISNPWATVTEISNLSRIATLLERSDPAVLARVTNVEFAPAEFYPSMRIILNSWSSAK